MWIAIRIATQMCTLIFTTNENEDFSFGDDDTLYVISVLINVSNVRGTQVCLRVVLNTIDFISLGSK